MESSLSSLIDAAEKGDGSATEALFSALYSELHRGEAGAGPQLRDGHADNFRQRIIIQPLVQP